MAILRAGMRVLKHLSHSLRLRNYYAVLGSHKLSSGFQFLRVFVAVIHIELGE